MTPLPGRNYTYKVLINTEDFASISARMRDEGLLWAFFPEIDPNEWDNARVAQYLGRQDMLVLGGYIDGELAGFLTLVPLRFRGRAGEIGLLAFRKFFKDALPLVTGAFDWIFRTQDCDALLGFIPVASRQSMRLFSSLSFVSMGRVPNMSWYAKKRRFVDCEIVMLTREVFYAQPEHLGPGSGGAAGTKTDGQTVSGSGNSTPQIE